MTNWLNDEDVVVDRSLVIKSKSGSMPADNRKIIKKIAGGAPGAREDYSTVPCQISSATWPATLVNAGQLKLSKVGRVTPCAPLTERGTRTARTE